MSTQSKTGWRRIAALRVGMMVSFLLMSFPLAWAQEGLFGSAAGNSFVGFGVAVFILIFIVSQIIPSRKGGKFGL